MRTSAPRSSSHLLLLLTLIYAASWCAGYELLDLHLKCDYHDKQCAGNSTVPSSGCRCDVDCAQFGDCCYDAPELDTRPPDFNWTCHRISTKRKAIFIFIINTCPADYGDESIKSKCTAPSSSDDPFLSVPISSEVPGRVYKNIYCAVCNRDADGAQPWTAWSAGNGSQQIRFEAPANRNSSLRECTNFEIQTCPSDDDRVADEDREKCRLYLAPAENHAKHQWGHVKNEFCARCNNISASELKCSTSPDRQSSQPTPGSYPYSIVLDINIKKGGSMVGSQSHCLPGYLFDPWKSSCRLITTCHSSGCDDALINRTQLACPRVTIERAHYDLFPNGTVLVHSRRRPKLLTKAEYILNATSAQLSVCAIYSAPFAVSSFNAFDGHLTQVGLAISIVSLAVKMLLFFFRREPSRTASILVLHLSACVLIAQSLFLMGVGQTDFAWLCKSIAILMHYFFLASFFWMNVLSYDVYTTFASLSPPKVKAARTRLLMYSIYGWSAPGVIIAGALLANQGGLDESSASRTGAEDFGSHNRFAPDYGLNGYCWISSRRALLVFFAAPLAMLLVINAGE